MKYDPDKALGIVEFCVEKLRSEAGAESFICVVGNSRSCHRIMKGVGPKTMLEAIDAIVNGTSLVLPNFMVADYLSHLASKLRDKSDDQEKMGDKVLGALHLIAEVHKED